MNVYEIAFLSTGISIFLNYIIGKPGSEFSPHEILSSYTVFLSERRLQKTGLYKSYLAQFYNSFNAASTFAEKQTIRKDFKIVLYNAAEPFFTWERAAGMCIVCTGFWISLITGICFTQNFVALLQIIVTSHVLLRIINKFL